MNRNRRYLLLCIALVWVDAAAAQLRTSFPPKTWSPSLMRHRLRLRSSSPARDNLLLVDIEPNPSIEIVAEPILRLAGLRINPRTGGLQRLVHYTGLSVQPSDGSPARRVSRLQRSIDRPDWSHDGKKIAFARDVADGVELWVADVATGQSKQIPGARLNEILGNPITWLSDNRQILAVLVPEGRGPAPAAPRPRLVPMCKKAPDV